MKIAQIARIKLTILSALLLAPGLSRAGYVALPSKLDTMITAGNYTTISGGGMSLNITFFNFSSTSNGGVAQGAGAVAVNQLAQSPLGFYLNGGFQAETGGATGSQNDIELTYMVSANQGTISQVGLSVDGTVSGTGRAGVTESIYSDAGFTNLVGTLSTTNGVVTTTLTGGSYTSLYIQKDIYDDTYDSSGTADLSIVGQTFSPSSVPEPASVAMVGLGLAGAFTFTRTRTRRKAVLA